MGELMGHHIERPRKPLKHHAVAIAVGHLRAVPEGVVHRLIALAVGLASMHTRDQAHAGIIERVAAEERVEEVVGGPGIVVGLVDRRILARTIPLAASEPAWKIVAAAGVVDQSISATARRRRGQKRGHRPHEIPHGIHGRGLGEIHHRPSTSDRIARLRHPLQQKGRNDAGQRLPAAGWARITHVWVFLSSLAGRVASPRPRRGVFSTMQPGDHTPPLPIPTKPFLWGVSHPHGRLHNQKLSEAVDEMPGHCTPPATSHHQHHCGPLLRAPDGSGTSRRPQQHVAESLRAAAV